MNNIYHKYLRLPFEIQKPEYCNQEFDMIHQRDLTFRHEGQDEIANNPHIDSQMSDWLYGLGCAVTHTECFYTPPGQAIPIHTDDLRTWDDEGHVKINVTWGPPEGTTRWWKSDKTIAVRNIEEAWKYLTSDIVAGNATGTTVENMERLRIAAGLDDFDVKANDETFSSARNYSETPFNIAKEDDCNLAYEANTNTPSLCNVGELHSTYNPTNYGRWTLCFVLGELGLKNKSHWLSWSKALEIFEDHLVES